MTSDTADLLCEHFLGRPASEAERIAMTGQMERDTRIASHAFGKEGGLFAVEPATFDSVLLAGAESHA